MDYKTGHGLDLGVDHRYPKRKKYGAVKKTPHYHRAYPSTDVATATATQTHHPQNRPPRYAVRMALNIRELVEAQIADKIEKGEALEQTIKDAEAAADALEQAQKKITAARRDALSAGWTETELKRLGLASARPARSRKSRTPKPVQQALGEAASE